MSSLIQFIKKFKDKKIAVLGDVMLDHYISGQVDRISPEAPVPVVNVKSYHNRAGGAANVALNICAYGANCSLFSVVGDDEHGKNLLSICKQNKINTEGIVLSKNRITTLKARIIGNNHQLLRYDYETIADIDEHDENKLFSMFKNQIKKSKIDALILEDYNKGVLTKNLIKEIIDWSNANGIMTLVDPKKKNFFEYKNCTLFKPNLKEIKEGLSEISIDAGLKSLQHASTILQKKLKNEISVITLAEKGIFYHQKNKSEIVSAKERKVADVSGAGDTVIATLALGMASGMDLHELMHLSNLAGGWVCEQPGVITIDTKSLIEEINHN
jgi:D-glycero-beta-D-manno-heptose-7-phosphate kinase